MTTSLGVGDGGQRLGGRPTSVGRDPHAADALGAGDPRLAVERRAILQLGMKGHRPAGNRHDAAADGQHAIRLAHRLLEVARDIGQRGDEQVAEGVAARTRARVVRTPSDRSPGSGTGAGGSWPARHRPAPRCSCGCRPSAAGPSRAQLARGSAVVGHRDDRRDVAGQLLQAAQQHGQAGAAADRHDVAGRARGRRRW